MFKIAFELEKDLNKTLSSFKIYFPFLQETIANTLKQDHGQVFNLLTDIAQIADKFLFLLECMLLKNEGKKYCDKMYE